MADKEKTEEQPAFKVTDHRRIHLDEKTGAVTSEPDEPNGAGAEASGAQADTATGPEAPTGGPAAPEAPPRPSQAAMDEAERRADAAAASGKGKRPAAPEMDFTTFVLSLGSSALVHLGDAAHPDTGKAEPNLIMAKQTIDMLAMLREKTKGNLARDEASYLDALLYDLRMRFVEATKRHG